MRYSSSFVFFMVARYCSKQNQKKATGTHKWVREGSGGLLSCAWSQKTRGSGNELPYLSEYIEDRFSKSSWAALAEFKMMTCVPRNLACTISESISFQSCNLRSRLSWGKYLPYFLPQCEYVNHAFLLGKSHMFPTRGKALGPGGKGRAFRLLRNMPRRAMAQSEVTSVHAGERLEKNSMVSVCMPANPSIGRD